MNPKNEGIPITKIRNPFGQKYLFLTLLQRLNFEIKLHPALFSNRLLRLF